MVRMKKLLSVKQSKLSAFKKMNVEAELMKAKTENIDEEFQKKYAYHVVGMEKLNRDILDHLSQLQTFSKELSTDQNVLATLVPSYMREKCRELAVQMVEKNNSDVHNETLLKLITNLTTVMWVTSYLNNNDQYGSVINVLENCLYETKSIMDDSNEPNFQKHVESHIRHIQLGLHRKSFQKQHPKLPAGRVMPDKPKTSITPRPQVPQKPAFKKSSEMEEIIINTLDSAEPEIDMIDVNEEEVEALNRSAQEREGYDEEQDDGEYEQDGVMEVEIEEEYLDEEIKHETDVKGEIDEEMMEEDDDEHQQEEVHLGDEEYETHEIDESELLLGD